MHLLLEFLKPTNTLSWNSHFVNILKFLFMFCLQHFLLLYHYKLQLEQVDMPEATSVFDGKSDKLQSMLNDLVQLVCMEVVFETKARSKPYRRDK